MSDPDLVTLAAEAAAAQTDLYELLGVDATTSKADIHRAWRRKGLQFHPDKAGAQYDAAKYEAFERARNILSDDAARAAYDGAVAAAAQRARRAEAMGGERRRFKEELEEAERRARRDAARPPGAAGGGGGNGSGSSGSAAVDAEREALREAGRRKVEERERAEREAEAREESRRDERIRELERRLDEKARRKAEKKRARGGGGDDEKVEDQQQQQQKQAQPPPPPPDGEWKTMLGGHQDTLPFTKRPIYAYTIARMKAAAAAADRRTKLSDTSEFVPRWDEVKDPAVRQYIARVPQLGPVSKTTQDADMVDLTA